MASITTAESGAKKRSIFGAKKARKKSAGRRRNGAISSKVGKTAKNRAAETAAKEAFVLPRLEFEMALEVAGPGDKGWGDKSWDDKNWTAIVRDAAEAAGGDLLFVLPYAESRDAKDGDTPVGATPDNATTDNGAPKSCAPQSCAMVRLLEDGESHLLLVRISTSGFHLVEETTIEPGLARFARASIEVLEQLGSDKRIVAPLVTLASH